MVEQESQEFDLGIIGGGPAGLSAAVYAQRRGLRCAVFEGKAWGGALAGHHKIENYVGFASVDSQELADKMKAHAEGVGAKLFLKQVAEVEPQKEGFLVKTDDSEEYAVRALVMATGSSYKNLQVKGEKEFAGKGVSYCATCDAPFFKNKTVAVVGGGNMALNTALQLADVAKRVIVVHREPLTADKAGADRLRERGNVEFVGDSQVLEIAGSGKFVDKLKLKNLKTNGESVLAVEGVFINVGLAPANTLCRELGVKTDEKGCIAADGKQGTNVPGVFVAGDCSGHLMQVIWAAAEGAQAAVSAYDFLKKK